ncbi:hypothetical protein OB919_14835 [Halobacteria archaeon AArc-curdl1]|uniref:DUF7998 domain-containing protein n=1 Tax=Natronosalvus hydrolyticus TaxID=2979988 RepID=A0AAP2Z9L5_9EURY|nr:hypothetical protein [Halobacteria archaeon AArc-curdl1]
MVDFASFRRSSDSLFDDEEAFVPEHVPDPGPFLEGHRVLSGDDHVEFHRLTRDLFEERTVYDMTFNYNLARLNLDTRHPDAGYRYALVDNDPSVLRAEFTPTTPFCPQVHTLTIGSFRAWNALADRHEYDLVRVRVRPMHHQSATVNDHLAALEEGFLETGRVDDEGTGDRSFGATDSETADHEADVLPF